MFSHSFSQGGHCNWLGIAGIISACSSNVGQSMWTSSSDLHCILRMRPELPSSRPRHVRTEEDDGACELRLASCDWTTKPLGQDSALLDDEKIHRKFGSPCPGLPLSCVFIVNLSVWSFPRFQTLPAGSTGAFPPDSRLPFKQGQAKNTRAADWDSIEAHHSIARFAIISTSMTACSGSF